MPEQLTPLYYTPIYKSLTEFQRLRYNQLTGLYFNEQIIFFEKTLAQNVIGHFLSEPISDQLKKQLRQFIFEESRHSEMFRRLNRCCNPEIYGNQDFYFIEMPGLMSGFVNFVSKKPHWFPLFLWFVLLQEERSLFFGRTFLKSSDTEPHFREVQRIHLMDEVEHIRWDKELLKWIWPRTSSILRKLNVHLLIWMVNEYFSTPKRAAVMVVRELVNEFPALRSQFPEIRFQLLELRNNLSFRRSLYSSDNVPDTFKLFRAWPEFDIIVNAIPGYVPG